MSTHRPSRTRTFFLAALWLGLAAGLAAAEGGFSATLAVEAKRAAGFNTLSSDELKALDQLVADDLAFARREKFTELDGSFVTRRSEAERKEAGLDRLTESQLAKLNELVAAAIAARPTPKERPRLKESDVLAKNRLQVHGSVSVAYGWGRGGDYRAGSLYVETYDPVSRVAIGLGVSSSTGGGYYYPGYYGYPDYYSGYGYYPATYGFDPFYGYAVAPSTFVGASYRGDRLEANVFAGDGACFRMVGGGFGGRGGGHGGRGH